MNWLVAWALGAALMTLAVLAIRALLKGMLSLRARYALWVILAVRLLTPVQLPFSFPVSLPALPELSGIFFPTPVRGATEVTSVEQADVFITAVPGTAEYENTTIYTIPSDRPDFELTAVVPGTVRGISWETALTALWAAGAVLVLGAVAVSNVRFSRKLRRVCRPLEVEGCPLPVYVAAFLPSPCLVGVFWPTVYLTPEAAEDETTLRHVLAHELTHYAHRDHLWGAVRCLCLALHWYNPLVWLAAALSKRDGELACDEGAVERLGESERIPYGKTLVGLVARRAAPADLLSCSTAMTESKRTVRERVELLVKQPHTVKTALFAAVSVLALCLLCAFAGGETAPAEDAPNGPYAWGHTQDFTPDPSQRGTWETDLRAVVTRQRGALMNDTLEVTGQPGGIETLTVAPEEVTFVLSGWNAALADYGKAVENLCQLPTPGDAGALSPWFRVIQDGQLVPGRGSFDRTNGVFTYAFDQPLGLPYVGDQVTIEIGPTAGAWSANRTFSPDPAGAGSWNTSLRAYIHNIGGGDVSMNVIGDTGALTELNVGPDGLSFTGYGYVMTAAPNVTWKEDPTFAALNDLALRGVTEDVRAEAARWLCVTRNGQRIPGTFRGHVMEGEAHFSFDFDEPVTLGREDQLEVRIGPTTVSSGSQAGLLPGVFPMDMVFSSGAGGWLSALTLQADGSFTGEYRDDDIGEDTAYVCTFHGRFRDIQPVTASSWSMVLAELALDTDRPVGQEWIGENGTRYISSTPYGFDRWDEAAQEELTLDAGAKFMFYTPDAEEELSGMQELCSWIPTGPVTKLGCYGLCSVETERGFFTGWY